MTPPDIASVHYPADGRVVLMFTLPAEAPAFAGHFPGHPVLPGVVQLDWAIRLASRYLGVDQAVAREFQVKFRHIIPSDLPITLSLYRDDARQRLDMEYRVGGEIASTARIRLERCP